MRRFGWGFLAFGLLAACSSNSSSPRVTASTDEDGQVVQTSIVVGADGSSSVVVVPPGDGGPGTPANPSGDEPAPPPSLDPHGVPGSYAPAYLRSSLSSDIVVEVRTQSGASPRQASIDHLSSVLRSVSGKAVAVTSGSAIAGGAQAWSGDDLRALGDSGLAQGNGHAVLRLLLVHGSFGGDESVLGVAVRGDLAAIFVDQVQASSTPLIGSEGIEVAVTAHEVGHLLGLVDLFLQTGRHDPEHPGHSTNPNSVMYWAVESSLVSQLLQGGPPKDFDGADLADLRAIRNGG